MLSFSFSWLHFPCGCHFLGHSIWPGGMREAIRRPTAGGAKRVGLQIQVLAKYLSSPSAQPQLPRPRSPDFPLSISPPGTAHAARPTPKLVQHASWDRFFINFLPFKKRFKIWIEKLCKKMGKSLVLGSKSLPKPSQNDAQSEVRRET